MSLGTQVSGVTVSNRRRTSDVFTPRAPSSTAAGSGGWRARIWASTCWAVSWSFRRLGLAEFLKYLLCRGRHAEAIFSHDVSDPRLLRHGAHRQWGCVGAGSHAQGTQGFLIERLKGPASLLQAHAQRGFDRGILQQGEQKVVGARSAITSATSLLTGPQIEGPGVMHLWHNGFGGHDDSLLYLVCTDWRVMPKASPICCHDQPFSRADVTWFASTLSARRWSANEARSPIAGSSDERFTLNSSMSMPVSMD